MKRNGVICVVFMLPSWVMILKLSKKCIFSILCWPQQKNLSMLIQYVYESERSRYTLLKISVFEIVVFDILISNISWAVAQTPINHIIFWKTVIRTFISIYVNCFNRLRFLAEVSTKLQKIHFMYNLRVISQEGSMKTRQMTPFLNLRFFEAMSGIHFYISKWSKFIFMWSSLWSILVCKIPQFWAKATESDSPSYFSRK